MTFLLMMFSGFRNYGNYGCRFNIRNEIHPNIWSQFQTMTWEMVFVRRSRWVGLIIIHIKRSVDRTSIGWPRGLAKGSELSQTPTETDWGFSIMCYTLYCVHLSSYSYSWKKRSVQRIEQISVVAYRPISSIIRMFEHDLNLVNSKGPRPTITRFYVAFKSSISSG
jgi:hypothetical protein